MDKFDRILALNSFLHIRQHSPPSLQEICEHLECSVSTAKRAIENYRNHLSAPLIFDKEQAGYRLENDHQYFELPGLWFNESELFALLISQRLLTDIQPGLLQEQITPIRNRIEKLLNLRKLGGELLNQKIRILQIARRPMNMHQFRTIASAVAQQQQLHINYHNRHNDQQSERTLSPQRIIYYRDNWYLDAWCHLREQLRTFSVDRIEPLKLIKKPAKILSDAQLDTLLTESYGIFAGRAEHTACLKFNPVAARWVADEDWHPAQSKQTLPDGSLELTLPYNNPTELIRDILKYGANVEVISPTALRNAVIQTLHQTIRLYEKK